jgi:deoxyribose-phosphate aldolase
LPADRSQPAIRAEFLCRREAASFLPLPTMSLSLSVSLQITMPVNKTLTELPDFRLSPSVDKVGVEERTARFQTRSIKGGSKMQGLKMVLGMIDLTTLEGKDTPGKVRQLCYKGMHLHDVHPDLPTVAAICVYPSMVAVARKAVEGSGIRIASVSTAFPSGQAPMEVKIADTRFAVDSGADEIDMVISRGKFLSGEYNYVFDEIAAIKEACGDARLKVILETGELASLDQVRRASDIAMYAGADFIKTSTGKIQPAATMQVTYTMLCAIKDFYRKTGIRVGMKPAGGISSAKLALHNLVMVKETLGSEWLSNEWFRFGASSLANDVLMQIVKQATGVYQSADYFSVD